MSRLNASVFVGSLVMSQIACAYEKVLDYISTLWKLLLKEHPDFPKSIDVHYECTINDSEHYFIQFTIHPQYDCPHSSCSHYAKACAGDVYAGDFLTKHIELIGHTGLLYTGVDEESSYQVIEVLETAPVIHTEKFLLAIEKERPVWGVRYGHGNLTKEGEMSWVDALKMIGQGLIQSQFCPQYIVLPIYEEGGLEYKDGRYSLKYARFRCDTFVQYLYQAALNTQLPPQALFHMPKDLFNAFPNQRGDLLPAATTLVDRAFQSKSRLPEDSDTLWHAFQSKPLSSDEKALALDLMDSLNNISFKALRLAIEKESNKALKAKLLFILFKKTKEETPRDEFAAVKAAILTLLHQEEDSLVLANALIISPHLLTPLNLLNEIKVLMKRVQLFSEGDLTLMTKTIHAVLFEVLVNSDSNEVVKEAYVVLTQSDLETALESLAVLINSMPEQGLTAIHKTYLRKLLLHPKSAYFHTKNFFKNHFRARSWSGALLKIKKEPLSNADLLYESVKAMEDPFVVSLLVSLNQEQIQTEKDKARFLKLLSPNKTIKPRKKARPFERGLKTRAALFLGGLKKGAQALGLGG